MLICLVTDVFRLSPEELPAPLPGPGPCPIDPPCHV